MKTKHKMNLQFFADGGENMDMAGLESLLNQGNSESQQTPSEPQVQESQAQESQAEESQTQPQQKQQAQSQPQTQDKAAHAFAQMRVENNQYRQMLTKVAQAAGIEFSNEKELIDKLNDNALEKLSQRQNIPVDVLKRLEQLEVTNQTYELEQRKSATMIAFQNLKESYNLDDQGLLNFAQELDAQGKNPFVQDVDIDAMYKQLHFEEIMNAKIAAAVEAALTKSNVADTHSSTPSSTQGRSSDGGQKISTVGELSALLSTL